MKNNTNTISVNATALRELRDSKKNDVNFRNSLERTAKLASYVVARSNWQTMIERGIFAGTFTNPARSLEIQEENEERLEAALSKFYRAFLWLCSETKKATGKALVEQYISYNKEMLIDAAAAFLATEVEIVKINQAEEAEKRIAEKRAVERLMADVAATA